MARIAPAIRTARTVIRTKTTPYTGAHVRAIAWTLVPLAVLAWKLGAPAAIGAVLASGVAYVAGQYAGLSQAWREEAPYTVELADGEDLPECTYLDR